MDIWWALMFQISGFVAGCLAMRPIFRKREQPPAERRGGRDGRSEERHHRGLEDAP